jgi:hypothetical protein
MPSGQKDRGVAPRDLATAADASGIHADIPSHGPAAILEADILGASLGA